MGTTVIKWMPIKLTFECSEHESKEKVSDEIVESIQKILKEKFFKRMVLIEKYDEKDHNYKY